MTVTAELAHYYTSPEEYLVAERISERKHEYLAGIVYAMAGTTAQHNRIVGNIPASLLTQLRGKPCDVFSNDIKVRITTDIAKFYYYPDVIVDCGHAEADSLFAEEPHAMFEVLSPETESIDRVEKLRNYQAIASLRLYALIDQHHLAVTAYRWAGNGWTWEFLTAKKDVLDLAFIDFALPFSTIYERTFLCP